MTKIAGRKPDPLLAPVADVGVPAADREVARNDNRPNPSADAIAAFEDALRQRDGFLARIDQLVEAASRAFADSEETAGRCADLQRQIAAAAKAVDSERETVKRPYLEAGRAVDDAAKRHSVRLNGALQTVKSKIEAYAREQLRLQREQRDREEAERRERDRILAEQQAAARAAGAPVPEPVPVPPPPPPPPAPTFQARGDYGSVASTQTVWKAEIDNWPQAFKAVQENENVREAVQKAINALVRSGTRTIKGVRVFEDVSVRVR